MINKIKYPAYFVLLVLLVVFFGFYSTPVWDIDFWWHIASGKYIVKTLSLPDTDPFAVYKASGIRNDTVLKAQWLGQVILYFTYNITGIKGIIFLKAFILTICLLIVYIRSTSLDSAPFYTMLVVTLAGITALNFTGERPQLFSFLSASAVFLLLDNFTKSGKKIYLFSICPVMFLWANSHGGVVLGTVLLIFYAFCGMVEDNFYSGGKKHINKTLLIATGAAVLATIVVPAGIERYLYVIQMEGSELQKKTTEYMTPFNVWKLTGNVLYGYWLMTIVSLPAVYQLVKTKEISKAALVIVLVTISLSSFRYIPFFIFIAGPYIAFGLSKLMPAKRISERVIYATVLVGCIFVLMGGVYYGKVFKSGIAKQRFPEGAVSYLKNNAIRGKILNYMEWGGYLIWHSYPDVQIFIDGRILDTATLFKYTHILWTTPEGLEFFKKGNFDFVLIPYRSKFSGESYPLIKYLIENPLWVIVYADEQGYLFAHNNENER